MTLTMDRVITKVIGEIGRKLRGFWYRQVLFRWIKFGDGVTFAGPIECLGVRGKVSIGARCYIGPWVSLSVSDGGIVEVGPDCSINKGSVISALVRVRIGRGCRIGENVSIRDNDHRLIGITPVLNSGFDSAAVTIGDDVWIGRNATIRMGVTIGNGAVIGAHSLVNRDVASFAVVVGAPARMIRSRHG